MAEKKTDDISKRKFPRRRSVQKIGILYKGRYQMSESNQIGEGGMLIRSPFALQELDHIVVSFMVPGSVFIIARSQVQYVMSTSDRSEVLYGLKFTNIAFDQRRKLRDFIAAKTEAEAIAEGMFRAEK